MIPPRVHLIGIGGIGMSALARVLMADGHQVSGSDLELSPLTDALVRDGARVTQGHRSDNVGDADLVVISSAVRPENPEVVAARDRGIPVIKRAELVGEVMASRHGIAIAGTHGKTTTTSLVALLLEDAGLDPTILSGGVIADLGTNAKRGSGPHIVVEADEFDGSFLRFKPRLAILTNVEADHLDFYGTLDAIVAAFRGFLALVPPDGRLIGCGDDLIVRGLVGEQKVAHKLTYGFGPENDWRAIDRVVGPDGGSEFAIAGEGAPAGRFRLRVPGEHNVLNALAAVAVARAVGIDPDQIRRTLARFGGAKRRFDLKGEAGGVTVVDDYGHHPTEVRVTLRAARERFPGRRLIALFQPHTYTRTQSLLDDFAACFADADLVLVSDIYAARETDDLGIHAHDLVDRIARPPAEYVGPLDRAADRLLELAGPGDVILTIGAGNVYRAGEEFLRKRGQP